MTSVLVTNAQQNQGQTVTMSTQVDDPNSFAAVWTHFKNGTKEQVRQNVIMAKKNAKLMTRNWAGTLGRLVVPTFFVLLTLLIIVMAKAALEQNEGVGVVNTKITALDEKIRKCYSPSGSGCITLAYAPNTAANTAVMQILAKAQGFEISQDSKVLKDIVGFSSISSMEDFIINNINVTQSAVSFALSNGTYNPYGPASAKNTLRTQFPEKHAAHMLLKTMTGLSMPHLSVFDDDDDEQQQDWDPEEFETNAGSTSPDTATSTISQIGYTLYSNNSMVSDFTTGTLNFYMSQDAQIDLAMTKALMQNYTGKVPDIKLSNKPSTPIQGSKSAQERLQASINGTTGLILYCGIMISVLGIITYIIQERTDKLREGMLMMGMKPLVYWTSTLTYYAMVTFFSSLLMCLVAVIAELQWFTNTNFIVCWLLFWLFSMATAAFNMAITTMVKTVKSAQVIWFLFFLVGIIIQFIFTTSPSPTIYDMYKVPTSAFWHILLSILFPWFNFIKCYTDIRLKAEPSFRTDADKHLAYFGLDDLSKKVDVLVLDSYPNSLDQDTNFPDLAYETPGFSMLILFFNILFYVVLTSYLDNVLPGEYGSPKHPLFFLTPKFWGLGSGSYAGYTNKRTAAMHDILPDLDRDVTREYDEVVSDPSRWAVRCFKLSKTYKKSLVGKSAQDVRALDMLTFGVEKGSVVSLLGHNGAGKTTTISILTGLYESSSGDASIYGYSVAEDMDKVRALTGVCPQHDVLWDDLTAGEHLELFALLKGLPTHKIENEIKEKLAQVRLSKQRDHLSYTFSGGMKRRLSLAIASIGDPKIIFMDEPTSGMDPLNKRHVWNLIQEMKKDRAVILTTHSMEEADVLSDKVCILALGRMRAIGSSAHLKSRFGAGYTLTVVTDDNRVAEVKNWITSIVPSARFDSESSGNIKYGIPRTSGGEVSHLLKRIEEEKQSQDTMILDWGLARTTLEEVFIRVIHGGDGSVMHGGDGADGDEFSGVQQLNIALEGIINPVGFIEINDDTELKDVRQLINAQLGETIPPTFKFLSRGVPLQQSQENRRAMAFMPLCTVRVDSSSSSSSSSSSAPSQEIVQKVQVLEKQVTELANENKQLVNQLKEKDEKIKELEEQLGAAGVSNGL